MVFFALRVSVRRKLGINIVMVCCPNSKMCFIIANNLTFPFPSYVSSLTGKNACFSPQRLVYVYLQSKMACLDLVRFGLSVEFSNSPQFYRAEC